VTEYRIEPLLFNGFTFSLALAMSAKYKSMYCAERVLKYSATIWNNSSKKLKLVLLWFIFNGQGEGLDFLTLILSDLNK